jgi:hypothetical protein
MIGCVVFEKIIFRFDMILSSLAKIDEAKEYIGFLKAIFITLIVIDTSLIAWVFKNFDAQTSFRFDNGIYCEVSLISIILSFALDK